uniref:Integrase core domain-containing protein n=1 Tax=Amphimedon queenslandica TaxID=400682 RepID=A0A1X7VHF6_AMPQE
MKLSVAFIGTNICVNAQLKGFLISRGYIVQQFRKRDSLRRVDMIGTAMRRLTKLVIHGCIDGFSRQIVYLQVSDNNRAETVVELFRDGVIRLGLPSRVRGGENVQVAEFK